MLAEFSKCILTRQRGWASFSLPVELERLSGCHSGLGERPESVEVLLQVTPLAILHDEVQVVTVCDERVYIFANMAMSHLAHQLLLLESCLHRIRVHKGDLFHRVDIVVH